MEKEKRDKGHSAMLGYIIHPTGDPIDKTGAVRERDRDRYRDRGRQTGRQADRGRQGRS